MQGGRRQMYREGWYTHGEDSNRHTNMCAPLKAEFCASNDSDLCWPVADENMSESGISALES